MIKNETIMSTHVKKWLPDLFLIFDAMHEKTASVRVEWIILKVHVTDSFHFDFC